MKSFLDTNILCYLLDESEEEKQQKAVKLLESLRFSETFVSTQVLQEFYNVLTKKMKHSIEDAKKAVKFAARYNVAQISVDTIYSAIDINFRYNYSFWDSLILASALENACDVLFSEDLQDEQIVMGIKICNPFAID